MNAFIYAVALQWKLDIRSKSLLITCYAVPLLFFAIMGGIFTAVNPQAKYTLIQSMTVMGVSMGALIGLPPSLAEIYGSDIRKAYRANGLPLSLGLFSMLFSAFIHLLLMSAIICCVAPAAFEAALPENLPAYFAALAVLIFVSLSIGSALGLAVKNQAKLTMVAQLVFLPSIMLSGILFPAELLPPALKLAGRLFPAFWGYRLMVPGGFHWNSLWPLLLILAAASLACALRVKRLRAE